MIKSKKAMSPLMSTLILIVIAIGIGVIAMNWGRAQLEAGSKCAINTEMSFVELNNVPQICYSGSGENGIIKLIVENGVNTDITSLQLRVIGSNKLYMSELADSYIETGYTLMKIVPYNFKMFGDIKQVKVTPKITLYPEEGAILCPEQSLVIEDIKECK